MSTVSDTNEYMNLSSDTDPVKYYIWLDMSQADANDLATQFAILNWNYKILWKRNLREIFRENAVQNGVCLIDMPDPGLRQQKDIEKEAQSIVELHSDKVFIQWVEANDDTRARWLRTMSTLPNNYDPEDDTYIWFDVGMNEAHRLNDIIEETVWWADKKVITEAKKGVALIENQSVVHLEDLPYETHSVHLDPFDLKVLKEQHFKRLTKSPETKSILKYYKKKENYQRGRAIFDPESSESDAEEEEEEDEPYAVNVEVPGLKGSKDVQQLNLFSDDEEVQDLNDEEDEVDEEELQKELLALVDDKKTRKRKWTLVDIVNRIKKHSAVKNVLKVSLNDVLEHLNKPAFQGRAFMEYFPTKQEVKTKSVEKRESLIKNAIHVMTDFSSSLKKYGVITDGKRGPDYKGFHQKAMEEQIEKFLNNKIDYVISDAQIRLNWYRIMQHVKHKTNLHVVVVFDHNEKNKRMEAMMFLLDRLTENVYLVFTDVDREAFMQSSMPK